MYTGKCGFIVIPHPSREELRTMRDDDRRQRARKKMVTIKQPKVTERAD